MNVNANALRSRYALPCFTIAAALFSVIILLPRLARSDDSKNETIVTAKSKKKKYPAEDPAGFNQIVQTQGAPAGSEIHNLLQHVPGLRVKVAGPSGAKSISLRGSESQQAVVIFDGIKLSSAMGGGIDLMLIDPGQLEEIEVHRGGNSTRFGSDALGGALILKTPQLKTRSRTSLSLGYGSFSSYSARVNHSASLGRLRYLASGSYRQSQGDFVYIDYNKIAGIRKNNDSRLGELLLKADYLLSEKWQIEGFNDFAFGERGAPGMYSSPSYSARQEDLRNLAALHLKRYDFLSTKGTATLSLYHTFSRFRFHQIEPTSKSKPSFVHLQTLGLNGSFTKTFKHRGRFDGGFELQGNLLEDYLGQLLEPSPRRLEVDLFASSQIILFDKVLTIIPAVRLATSSNFAPVLLPKGSFILRPFDWTESPWVKPLTLMGNLGRSYRLPSFQELYINLDSLRGNPTLSPEDSLDGDLGLRFLGSHFSWEIAYFRRYIKNVIIFAFVDPFRVEAQDFNHSRAEGIELSLDFHPGWGLSFSNSYTHTHTVFEDPPLLLPGHPKHRWISRLGWQWPKQKHETAIRWSFNLWAETTLESSFFLDRFNNLAEEARFLLAAGASFRYRKITLSSEGRNLLDKRDAVDTVGFPLPPARFLIALSLSL